MTLLEVDAEAIEFTTNINRANEIENGRLLKEDWDGYASRFAHGQPDSPFKDFEYLENIKPANNPAHATSNKAS